MINKLIGISVLIMISGCANLKPEGAINENFPPLRLGSTRIEMNVHGGYLQETRSDFDNKKGDQIKTVMGHRNFHEKWVPTQFICVGAKLPSNEVCIIIASMTTADKTQLEIKRTVTNIDQTDIVESFPIKGEFPIKKEIVIDVNVLNGILNFKINNDIDVNYRPEFVPEVLRFGCSSVECTFEH
jgi:hypothetical protein